MFVWFLIRLTFVIIIASRRFARSKRTKRFNHKIDIAAVGLFLIFLDPILFIRALEFIRIDTTLFALGFSMLTFGLCLYLIAAIKFEWSEGGRSSGRIE